MTFPKTTDKSWDILPDDKENWDFSSDGKNVCAYLESEGQYNQIFPGKSKS